MSSTEQNNPIKFRLHLSGNRSAIIEAIHGEDLISQLLQRNYFFELLDIHWNGKVICKINVACFPSFWWMVRPNKLPEKLDWFFYPAGGDWEKDAGSKKQGQYWTGAYLEIIGW